MRKTNLKIITLFIQNRITEQELRREITKTI